MKHKWICSKAPQTSPVPSRPDWKLTDFTKRTMLLLSILASTRHRQPIQWPVFQYRANKYNNLMIAITDVRGHIYFTDIYPKNLVLYAGAVLGGGGGCRGAVPPVNKLSPPKFRFISQQAILGEMHSMSGNIYIYKKNIVSC